MPCFEEIRHLLVFLGREARNFKGQEFAAVYLGAVRGIFPKEVGKRDLKGTRLRQIHYFIAIRQYESKQAKRNFPIEGIARQSRNPKNA